jgi:hypothetical protein
MLGKGALMGSMTKLQKALMITEKSIGASCALLAVVTIFWRDWIEIFFNWDPDHHNGSAEIGIICGLALTGLVLVLIARWQNRRWSSLGTVSDAA